MNKKIIISLILITIAILAAILILKKYPEPEINIAPVPKVVNDSASTPENIEKIINGNNKFAFELFSQLNNQENNIFFSPYSISSAFAMVYEGAEGQTKEEIKTTLNFPEKEILKPNLAKIYNTINKKDKGYILHTANALWVQQDYPILDQYKNSIEQYYGAKATNLNFMNEPEQSVQIINNWIETQTNNKIKDAINKGDITPETTSVLTNAIYFKGDWILEFDKGKTKEANFEITPDKTTKVQMMNIKKATDFNYTETDELQILELPYKGQELSMLVILPKENNIEILNEKLNKENYDLWRSELQEKELDVFLPRFKLETRYQMKKTLNDMGMKNPFTLNADFSGMDRTNQTYIEKVIHKAFIKVNEEGTEAAATTAIFKRFGIADTFKADHPFAFIIQEKNTGNILFMGKITDPNQ